MNNRIHSGETIANEELNGFALSAGWPRSGDPDFPGWRHSDVKNFAPVFVLPCFRKLVQQLETAR